jgi:hypothetical protein
MTLHTIPSEFPYMWGKVLFSFLSVYSLLQQKNMRSTVQATKPIHCNLDQMDTVYQEMYVLFYYPWQTIVLFEDNSFNIGQILVGLDNS